MSIVIILGILLLIGGILPLGKGRFLVRPYSRIYGLYLLLVAPPIIKIASIFFKKQATDSDSAWIFNLLLIIPIIFLGLTLIYKWQISDEQKEVISWRKRICLAVILVISLWLLLLILVGFIIGVAFSHQTS